MQNIIEINNLDQPEVAVFSRLTEAQLRSRLDGEKAMFIAESPKVIRLALEMGCRPYAFLMEKKHITGDAADILARHPDVPVYTGDREVLAALTGFTLTRGVLCAMYRPARPDVEQVCIGARRVAVLEGIADATNVGAIFRSAAALNVDAVLVSPTCCDPLNRRAVRVSMGTVFQVPWTQVCDTPEQWESCGVERLKEMGFTTVAMALGEKTISVEDKTLLQKEKLAIFLGTEGTGLEPQTIRKCDFAAKIPMSHKVDSLNVAAASAVAFWELRKRQE